LYPLCWILLSFCIFFLEAAGAHAPAGSRTIGIKEHIGETVPPDITLKDEQGHEVALAALIKRPTILTLVYYSCGRFCPQLLAALAETFPQLPLKADKDYQVMTVSFDASDTPAVARDLKRNYLMAIGRPFPPDAWHFLSGDSRNIERLCAAVGFRFRKEHDGFAHPVALIILSPERRISSYVHVSKFAYGVEYPITFSPIGLSQVLADASQGRLSASTGKEFLFCFPHEPYRQETFYHILAAIGAATILGLVLFFVYLAASSRKKQEGRGR
jgi:protein SCO1/2